jgi:asparagine synthase (glutamine-hydrolysing)
LLEKSVELRMVSDVPLGAFLSGGIDSSIIVALASRMTRHLNTFSIGFRDEPYFDETYYANLVAKKCMTTHTVISLTNDDLFGNLFSTLDYIDEPFADSSALNLHIISMEARKLVKVALTGDGADELFGGYNKHAAEMKARSGGLISDGIKLFHPFWRSLPQSRNTRVLNKIRQLHRYSEGASLHAKDRYWRWASFMNEQDAMHMLFLFPPCSTMPYDEYIKRRQHMLQYIREDGDLNDMLYTDMMLPLPNDMLMKVDLMSMANSLEIRTPFLDYHIVDFAFSLPSSSKISVQSRKKIIRDAFRKSLPEEVYYRKKQGFEVPLLKWMNHELKTLITDDLLSDKLIHEQGIFDAGAVKRLKQKLFSNNPGEAALHTWTLIVFQYWWKKYFY